MNERDTLKGIINRSSTFQLVAIYVEVYDLSSFDLISHS